MSAADKSDEKKKADLAPQPGATNVKQADSGDAAIVFFLGLGKFFSGIFRMKYELCHLMCDLCRFHLFVLSVLCHISFGLA